MNIGVFLVSYCFIVLVFVYGIDLPTLVTGEEQLVKEYYFENMWSSLILDAFLIGFYWWIADWIWTRMKIESVFQQGLIFVLTTFLISSLFWLGFTSFPLNDKNFWSKWFYRAGWKAVAYDMILLGLFFVVYQLNYFLI